MKFKLLEGQHVQGGHWTADGRRIKGTKFNRGDVFESTTDLMVLNNGARRPKFERLPDDAPLVKAEPKPAQPQQKPTPPNAPKPNFAALEAMNVKQLQDHAAAEEIELGQAKTKEEMLKIIKAAS